MDEKTDNSLMVSVLSEPGLLTPGQCASQSQSQSWSSEEVGRGPAKFLCADGEVGGRIC